jgi:hypothetical protein
LIDTKLREGGDERGGVGKRTGRGR